LYLSDTGIKGYRLQRNIDGFDKEPAMLKRSIAEWATTFADEISVVDLGARRSRWPKRGKCGARLFKVASRGAKDKS
jgi:hypothetical protein